MSNEGDEPAGELLWQQARVSQGAAGVVGNMGRRYWFFPLAIAACAIFVFEARAGDWEACKNSNPDVSIFACSAIIDAGTDSAKDVGTAYYNRGVAYDRMGNLDGAIADYGKAIALNPKDADAHLNRGVAYEKPGKKPKAAADYRKALALNPGYELAIEGLQRLDE